MNWEVWTMPRKTSCCNGTLLRSDVRHYWPAGFLYVLVWLMILPIPRCRQPGIICVSSLSRRSSWQRSCTTTSMPP